MLVLSLLSYLNFFSFLFSSLRVRFSSLFVSVGPRSWIIKIIELVGFVRFFVTSFRLPVGFV